MPQRRAGSPTRTHWIADLTAAGAAAVLWWGINALNLFLTYDDKIPSQLAQLVLPAGILGSTWGATAPWGVLVTVFSALAVGSTTLFGFRVLRPRHNLLSRWFVLIAAAAIAGLALGLGTLGANWPPAFARFALEWFPGAIEPSVLWGLVWGWIPALLAGARFHTPRRTRTSRDSADAPRTRLHWLPAALIAAASVALLTLTVVAGTNARIVIQAPPSTPSASPTPSTPSIEANPVPPIASDGSPAPAGSCTSGQVALTVVSQGGATGHLLARIAATNTSSTTCTLDGYPDLAFGDSQGNLVPMTITHGATFGSADPGPTPITLPPDGGTATAPMSWTPGTSSSNQVAAFAYVAPAAGTTRTRTTMPVQIAGGSTIDITAWQAQTP